MPDGPQTSVDKLEKNECRTPALTSQKSRSAGGLKSGHSAWGAMLSQKKRGERQCFIISFPPITNVCDLINGFSEMEFKEKHIYSTLEITECDHSVRKEVRELSSGLFWESAELSIFPASLEESGFLLCSLLSQNLLPVQSAPAGPSCSKVFHELNRMSLTWYTRLAICLVAILCSWASVGLGGGAAHCDLRLSHLEQVLEMSCFFEEKMSGILAGCCSCHCSASPDLALVGLSSLLDTSVTPRQ